MVVACATTMTVPVVGALLIFSLMIGPPAAARCLTDRPVPALVGSVAIALVTVWAALACSYRTDWPVGFFVGVFGAAWYGVGRAVAAWRRRRGSRSGVASSPSQRTNPAERPRRGSDPHRRCPGPPLTWAFLVVGTGVDPVTSRFSGARSTN